MTDEIKGFYAGIWNDQDNNLEGKYGPYEELRAARSAMVLIAGRQVDVDMGNRGPQINPTFMDEGNTISLDYGTSFDTEVRAMALVKQTRYKVVLWRGDHPLVLTKTADARKAKEYFADIQGILQHVVPDSFNNMVKHVENGGSGDWTVTFDREKLIQLQLKTEVREVWLTPRDLEDDNE